MNKKIFIFLGIFIFAILIGWLVAKYYIFSDGKRDNYFIELKDGSTSSSDEQVSNQEITTIKVFLPIKDEIMDEDIFIQKKDMPLEIIEAALNEYIKRLQDGFKNTEILGIYRDRNNTIYLDFSEGIRNNFYGDTNKEYLFLKSLYKTVISNMADVEDVRILLNGKEIDTIGGHIFILYGLKEAIRIDE